MKSPIPFMRNTSPIEFATSQVRSADFQSSSTCRNCLFLHEPAGSGTGVPPVRTRRPTHGRDARATSLRADLEVRAPIPRFMVPMHSKKRKRAFHEPATQIRMTNDEIRMTNDETRRNTEIRMTKPPISLRLLRLSGFGFVSAFCHSPFVIRQLSVAR